MASNLASAARRPEDAGEPFLELLADQLADTITSGAGGTITWLNHFSAQVAMEAGVPLDEFDYLGLDGLLLCRLLGVDGSACRTSADLVLPRVLERAARVRIALIGSTAETLQAVAAKIEAEYGHDVVLVRDGYSGLPDLPELRRELRAAGAQLVVVGLGTPLQDFYALGLRRRGLLVATCGGWLDQFSADTYYPDWAYPLRLNWLVRLAKEPRRLWRRYTVDAVRALRSRAELAGYIAGRGGRPLAAAMPPDAGTVDTASAA
jgi:exopolysaccharide biosynthesis WecB/TagA/CpsF family protein